MLFLRSIDDINPLEINSVILSADLLPKLEETLKYKSLNNQKWTLLYRASENGFRAIDFHSKCDNIANTLTLIKTTSGNIFGGYTFSKWCSYTSTFIKQYRTDKDAFVFSLVNYMQRVLIFQSIDSHNPFGDGQKSICCSVNIGPTFGEGPDFCIADRCNSNANSCSSLGKTFVHPDFPFGSDKANTILAGSPFFQVAEIEVFQKV